MKYFILLISVFLSINALAQCYGSDSYKTCHDNNGNTYSVQKFGNTISVQGQNNQTRSSWNQSTTKVGNSTFTNGTSANGNSWNSTTNKFGDNTLTTGTDSDGNSFSSTCNQYGCY